MENLIENCYNCNNALPVYNDLYFCPFCATQVKCKSCNEKLVPKAIVCMVCGTQLLKPTNGGNSNQTMNEFDFEQKGDSKKFKSRFSNEVGSVFAEALGIMLGSAQAKRLANPFASSSQKGEKATIPLKSKADIEDAQLVDPSEIDNSVLNKYFRDEDGKLKLINTRLKQSGKLDQAIRLSIITLFSYEVLGQAEVERSVLVEMLTHSSLYDAHFKNWLAKCDEILKNGNKLQLSVPGRETAQKIVKEISDDTIEKGSISFSKINKGGGRRSRVKGGASEKEGDSSATAAPKKKDGAMYYLNLLLNEGFFKEKREINEIVKHLKDNKAESFAANEISTPLKRMIKSGKLKREKSAERQYEYFT